MINQKRLLYLLKKSIQIDTQNPPGNERALAKFLKDFLKDYKIKAELIEFFRKRSNLIFKLSSENSKKVLIVMPHLDTVPATGNWHTDPLKAVEKNNRIYGLGTTDCKGNLAAGLEALISLKENYKLKNLDILFCATADEETGSHKGLIPLLENKVLKGDFCLVLDSDNFEIIIAQKGLLQIEVEIKGKPIHAAFAEKGINAIKKASEFIEKIYKHKFTHKKHPLLGAPTVNVGTISGGIKPNVVAPNCKFSLDVRYLPSLDSKKILEDIKKILSSITKNFKIKILDIQKPIEIDKNNFWIERFTKVLKDNNLKPKFKGSLGATVMSILNDFKIKSFSFGVGVKSKAHSANEFVFKDSLIKGAKLLYEYFKELDKSI